MSNPAAADPLEALIEAWAMETGLPEDVISDFLHHGFSLTLDLDDLTKFANRVFAAGRDAQREDDAQIDWLQLVRDHDMQGYVCSCGADVNEQDWHLALSIQAAIGSSKPTEEDN